MGHAIVVLMVVLVATVLAAAPASSAEASKPAGLDTSTAAFFQSHCVRCHMVAGGGFRHGQHLAFDPSKHPPLCNLYAQFLRRLGADVNGFSTSTAASLPGFEMA